MEDLGWFVGSSTYDIISISEDELFVRIIQAGDGFAWYQRFTSTNPLMSLNPVMNFTDLVWEDDFNTDGALIQTNGPMTLEQANGEFKPIPTTRKI